MGVVCSRHGAQVGIKESNVLPALIAPMRFNRDDAEKLLVSAQEGSYVFSYDIASEYFVSVSAGEYVCHHAIARKNSCLIVGGRSFSTINDAIQHFKTHPLGSIKLKKQFSVDQTFKPALKKTTSYSNKRSLIRPTTRDVKPDSLNQTIFEDWKKNRNVVFKTPTPRVARRNENRINDKEIVYSKVEEDHVSVSSGGFEEVISVLDELIPIIPEPTGVRPPPLFPRFSNLNEEFTNTTDFSHDSKQHVLFELYKGNPKLKYSTGVNMFKVIVIGEAGTHAQRQYLSEKLYKEIDVFTSCHNIYWEYIDFMLDYTKSDLGDSPENNYNNTIEEIDDCEKNNIPFILLVNINYQLSSLYFPNSFSTQDFEYILGRFSIDHQKQLKRFFVQDSNVIPPRFVVNDGDNKAYRKEFMEITLKYPKIFSEDRFCSLITFEISRAVNKALRCSPSRTVVVHRTDDTVSPLENTHKKQEDGDVKSLNKYFQNVLKKLRFSEEMFNDHENYIEITLPKISMQNKETEEICFQKITNVLKEKIQIFSSHIQATNKLKSIGDVDYDEVLYHVTTSVKLWENSVVNEDLIKDLKEYIQSKSKKALLVNGSKWSGKSSLLSHVSQIAFNLFNGACCVVCRFVGHTIESSSFEMLLRSICLQISYAYSAAPNAVPQTTKDLIKFFSRLLDLATDSMPLVLVLDSLDRIETNQDDINPLDMLSTTLQENVKMIISVESRAFAMKHICDCVEIMLPDFTTHGSLEYIDHHLVKLERTLDANQQGVVSTLLGSNSSPTYVKLLVKELISWRSCDTPKITMKNLQEWISFLYQTAPTAENTLAAFFYLLTIESLGTPKEILVEFLKEIIKTKSKVAVYSNINLILNHFDVLCKCELVAGHLQIRLNDNEIRDVLKIMLSNDTHIYVKILNPVIKAILHKKLSVLGLQDNAELSRQTQHLFSYIQRISRHFQNVDEIKTEYFYNFNYISNRLKYLSLAHIV